MVTESDTIESRLVRVTTSKKPAAFQILVSSSQNLVLHQDIWKHL